ncbi:VTT domain-containing protein [Nitrospirillum amazonense]|uniref:VTT domain-containing protein n=1 Tax=Nitrospirillum amazonense TaxID=28077 RepID=UPI0016442774|nr:VTT domain-containing protein [Nitrospirillum amazonense]
MAGLIVVLAAGGHHWLTVETLSGRLAQLSALVADHPLRAAASVFGVALGVAARSLPAATVVSLAAGYAFGAAPFGAAPFGAALGALLSVAGGTLGGTLVFLALRRAGVGGLAGRLPGWLAPVANQPWAVILVLRLLPIMPFSAINVLAAAIRMPAPIFIIGTGLGAYPPQFLYALLGARLPALLAAGERPGLGLVLRPEVGGPLALLVLLALAPVAIRHWRRGA